MASTTALAQQDGDTRARNSALAFGHAALMLAVSSTTIFVLSAIVAFGTTYDQQLGRSKLSLMLIGLFIPLALAVFVRKRVETILGILGVAIAVAAPVIGGLWIVMPALLPVAATDDGKMLIANVFRLPVPVFDVGAVAGNLSLLIPLAGCGLVWAVARNQRALFLGLSVCMSLAAGAIMLSGEQSATLGLLSGALLAAFFLWRLRLAEPSPILRIIDVALLATALLVIGVYCLLLFAPDRTGQLGEMLPDYYRQRFTTWRDALLLISDYLYTGTGFGSPAMALSSYLFMLHVPFMEQVHNLYLQVALEQGLPGLIGLVGMLAAAAGSLLMAIRRAHGYIALCAAFVLAAVFALAVGGLFEADIYAGSWVAAMFLPFGFAWVVAEYDVLGHPGAPVRPIRWRDLWVGMIPVLALVALALWPGASAQWLANQGAVAQARVELGRYEWGLFPSQDAVRIQYADELKPAIDLYHAALANAPLNVTALRRLGQIQLSLGELDKARNNLEAAYVLAPGQQPTRQMLGEVYALQGAHDKAVALWQTVENGENQFTVRKWWYEAVKDPVAVTQIDQVIQAVAASKGDQQTSSRETGSQETSSQPKPSQPTK